MKICFKLKEILDFNLPFLEIFSLYGYILATLEKQRHNFTISRNCIHEHVSAAIIEYWKQRSFPVDIQRRFKVSRKSLKLFKQNLGN